MRIPDSRCLEHFAQRCITLVNHIIIASMKTTTCFGLMVAAGLIGALPAEQRRQIDTSWDDEFIPQPINFQFRKAGSACEYQLNYDRFAYDNRYDVQYIAEYSDGSQ